MTPVRCAIASVTLAWAGFIAPAMAETIIVTIDNMAFQPARVSAKVGDTVEWVNHDILAHTATATGGDWNLVLPPRKSGRTVMEHAGTVTYFCKFHPNMTGQIVITR
jgi:plastocyanin